MSNWRAILRGPSVCIMPYTRNFADVIRAELKSNPKLAKAVRAARVNGDIAQIVYDTRRDLGWSKKKLAKLVGLKKADITSIESTDYKITLSLLRKFAEVFNLQLKISFEKQDA